MQLIVKYYIQRKVINTVDVRNIMIQIIRDVLLSPCDGGYVQMGLDGKRKGEMVVFCKCDGCADIVCKNSCVCEHQNKDD